MFDNLQKAFAQKAFKVNKSTSKSFEQTKSDSRSKSSESPIMVSKSTVIDAPSKNQLLTIRALRPSIPLPVQPAEKTNKADLTDTFVSFKKGKSEQQTKALKSREAAVKQHEAAHLLAGSGITSGLSYTYQQASDGSSYAIGGQVTLNMQEGATPEETIQRAQKMRAAALAPSSPSAQDQDLAMMAMKMEAQAREERAEKQKEVQEKLKETSEKFKEVADEMMTGPSIFPYMNNVGDPTYLPLESDIVTPAPTSSLTGKVFATTDPKESERRPVMRGKKFQFRPVTGTSSDPKINREATTQRKRYKPKMVVFSVKLKTNAKPVIYTSEADTYKSVETSLKKNNISHKVDLVLTSKSKINNLKGTTQKISVDADLGKNISKLLAVV
jgi:hypothetical protein